MQPRQPSRASHAARTHHLINALTTSGTMTFADKGYQGAAPPSTRLQTIYYGLTFASTVGEVYPSG